MTRVLIVDDNVMNLRPLEATLRGAGYEVQAATSGHDALVELELGAVALVISDVDMPYMSGLELVQAMETRRFDVPVILVSARDAEHVRSLVQSPLIRFTLQKPVAERELLALIRSVLRA